MKICFMTVGGKGSDCCLIYIALSKDPKESISHMRKQLQFIHCLFISAGTKNIVSALRSNPNYDIMNLKPIREQFIPQLFHYSNYIWTDPATILNLYLSMRLHPMTRGAINNIVLRYKPSKEKLYFNQFEEDGEAREGEIQEQTPQATPKEDDD